MNAAAPHARSSDDVATSPKSTPIGSALAAVASEVSELAHLSDRLQELIGEVLVADGVPTSASLREFQALDLLGQRLHGVAAFVDALSGSTPAHWRIDAKTAAANLALADLARRLGESHASTTASRGEDAVSGDLDLFG